jgi:hypothetical protein
MRPAELVRRADQHVDADLGDVDRPVRRPVDGVDPGERAGLVRELGDLRDLGDRPDGVRGPRVGNDARAVAELPLEVVEVEGAVVADAGEADDEVAVAGKLEPGRDVRVVVEPRHEDLVAGAPVAGGGAREREVERRHVRAEDDLLRRAAEPARAGEAGVRDERVGRAARLVLAADVRVRLAQVARDRLDHLVGRLRPAGSVEEGERRAQRREAPPHRLDVQRDGAHPRDATSRPFTRQR